MRGIVKERWSAHGFARKKYFHLYILEQAAWLIRGTLAARRHSPRTFFLAEGVWIWWWDDVIGFAEWFVMICDLQDTPCTVQAHVTPMAYLCLWWEDICVCSCPRSWSCFWYVSISSGCLYDQGPRSLSHESFVTESKNISFQELWELLNTSQSPFFV